MQSTTRGAIFLPAVLLALGMSAPAHADVRTWVSGTGNDANPCSVRRHVRLFAGAMPRPTLEARLMWWIRRLWRTRNH